MSTADALALNGNAAPASIRSISLSPFLSICGLPDLQDAQLAMRCCTSAGQGVQTLNQLLSQGVRRNILHTRVEMSFICN